MPRYQRPTTTERPPLAKPYSQTADLFAFGITRGASGLPQRDPGSSGRELYDPAESFEQSYRRFEFSMLVELSLDLLRWLMRMRRKVMTFGSARASRRLSPRSN